MSPVTTITFWGTRGSTPCHGPDVERFGGNTSCTTVTFPGHAPIVFDLGTGLRDFGRTFPKEQPFVGHCLVSHLHWDHIQGLPYFSPMLHPQTKLHVYAPNQDDGRAIGEVFGSLIKPPTFPIELDAFPGRVEFREVGDERFEAGGVAVTAARVPHVGTTLGFRAEAAGASVAYVSDHQQPGVDDLTPSAAVVELARGVDVLIHDAQYSPEEFAAKSDWGHSTADYAFAVARAAGVRRLVLFHHDPARHDDELAEEQRRWAERGAAGGVEVITASDGLTITIP